MCLHTSYIYLIVRLFSERLQIQSHPLQTQSNTLQSQSNTVSIQTNTLSAGAIAGIVIGCIVGFCTLVTIVKMCTRTERIVQPVKGLYLFYMFATDIDLILFDALCVYRFMLHTNLFLCVYYCAVNISKCTYLNLTVTV